MDLYYSQSPSAFYLYWKYAYVARCNMQSAEFRVLLSTLKNRKETYYNCLGIENKAAIDGVFNSFSFSNNS